MSKGNDILSDSDFHQGQQHVEAVRFEVVERLIERITTKQLPSIESLGKVVFISATDYDSKQWARRFQEWRLIGKEYEMKSTPQQLRAFTNCGRIVFVDIDSFYIRDKGREWLQIKAMLESHKVRYVPILDRMTLLSLLTQVKKIYSI